MKKGLVKLFIFLVFSFGAVFFGSGSADAAILRDKPVTLTQPDGSLLACYISGDEYLNYYHDGNDNVIIQSPATGYYTYAVNRNGDAASSGVVARNSTSFGFSFVQKPINVMSVQRLLENADEVKEEMAAAAQRVAVRPAPVTGTLNSLAIYIRFRDEAEFTDSQATYNDMFNSSTDGQVSLKNYYKEVSGGKLVINTPFYPANTGTTVKSYRDPYVRRYYEPYNSVTNPGGYRDDTERMIREYTLLKNAVASISSSVSTSLNIDGDNNGFIDDVCFIVNGASDGWSDLLWPHQMNLSDVGLANITINNKTMDNYQFQLVSDMNVSVLAHETFHVLGAPDLYHYYDYTTPVGPWDVMEYNLEIPQHMSAYMKMKYGKWISTIPEIDENGTYTLAPNTAYIIRSPISVTEFYVVEYRKKAGIYESSLPGSGLIVHRINSNYYGNADGPPDEVYVYRPYNYDSYISDANFSSDYGRGEIGGDSNPMFLTDGENGEVRITSIGSCGSTISFQVVYPYGEPTDFAVRDSVLTHYIGSDAQIIIPGNLDVTVLGENVFYKMESIVGVQVPEGVTVIRASAFEKCTKLEKVIIPTSVTSIGDDAFKGCNKLVIYGYKGSFAERYATENGLSFSALPFIAPPSVSATSSGFNSIQLKISPVAGGTGYVIYRALSPDGPYRYLSTITGTEYTDTALTTGTAYYYRVYPLQTMETYQIPGSASTAVIARPMLGIPKYTAAAKVTPTSIRLVWKPTAGASGYIIYRYHPETKRYEIVKMLPGTSFVNTGLKTSTAYLYRIAAFKMVNGKMVCGLLTHPIYSRT